MNELTVFQNQEFGRLRTAEINDEVWFVGKDVARALGYSNPRDAISRHVDAEDKGVVKHDTHGGNQPITVINESGLYSLVLSSKLPGAKRFKHWVTSEVLPSIRKHGGYGNGVSAEHGRRDGGGDGKTVERCSGPDSTDCAGGSRFDGPCTPKEKTLPQRHHHAGPRTSA